MSQGPAESADLGALAELAPELASTFVSVASDIALVIGSDGVIRNVAQGQNPLVLQAAQWVGRPFVDTVTQDTRGKIQQLLLDVGASGVSRRREVNLPGAEGLSIPVSFAAIRLGVDGPVLAVGRDLRAIAAIQQQFVQAQQELERDYWRQRQAESRYRLLFQVATDAVLVVDAGSFMVMDANQAAAVLFGVPVESLLGEAAGAAVAAGSRPAVDELLATARSTGKPAEIRARLRTPDGARQVDLVDVSATPFRAVTDGASQLLLMVRARRSDVFGVDGTRRLADYVEHTPDAVVITDSSGRLLMANPAFLQLCPSGLAEGQLKGQSLADALGDPTSQLEQLVAEVRRQGIVSRQRVGLGLKSDPRGLEVEVSAALLDEGDQECIGLTLRRQPAQHDHSPLPGVGSLAVALQDLVVQLGRVSLPELMHEATHLAERHLIRQAMARGGGDLGATAQWLGITPESLALRLQRHGLLAPSGHGSAPNLLN